MVVGDNVYTVGDRVKLGLELKLRVLWRKAKNMIKAKHFTRHPSAEVAKNHLPPPSVWEGRTQEEWNELVDWFSHPDQVARSAVNAANRAKNTIPTNQGKKSFAQGRNEYVRLYNFCDMLQVFILFVYSSLLIYLILYRKSSTGIMRI